MADQLQKKVADLAKRLGLDTGTTDSRVVQKGIQKIANRIDKFSNRVDAILQRRVNRIASKEQSDRMVEFLKDAGSGLIKGGVQKVADQWQEFRNGEISVQEFILKSVEGAIDGAIGGILGSSSKNLKLQGRNFAAYVTEVEAKLLMPTVKHIFALITHPPTSTAAAVRTRDGLAIPTTLRPVLTQHLKLPIRDMSGVGNKPTSLTMATAETWQSQPAGQSVEEGDLSATDLVWLALFVLGADSDAGPLFTAAERDLLETAPLGPDVSVEQRYRLVQNVQTLAEGTADPALTAALEGSPAVAANSRRVVPRDTGSVGTPAGGYGSRTQHTGLGRHPGTGSRWPGMSTICWWTGKRASHIGESRTGVVWAMSCGWARSAPTPCCTTIQPWISERLPRSVPEEALPNT